jgi:hypothetical protein
MGAAPPKAAGRHTRLLGQYNWALAALIAINTNAFTGAIADGPTRHTHPTGAPTSTLSSG